MREIKTYRVETSSYKKEIRASSLTDAIIKAFQKSAPQNPSILTRVKEVFPLKRKRKDGQWHYIKTVGMLKKAGYKIEK